MNKRKKVHQLLCLEMTDVDEDWLRIEPDVTANGIAFQREEFQARRRLIGYEKMSLRTMALAQLQPHFSTFGIL